MRLPMKKAIAVAEVAPEETKVYVYNEHGDGGSFLWGHKGVGFYFDHTYEFIFPDGWQLNTGTPPDCDEAEVIFSNGEKTTIVAEDVYWGFKNRPSNILIWRPAEDEKPEPAPRLYTYRGVGDGAILIADNADHENGYWRPIPDAELVEMLLNISGLVESLSERLREVDK